MILTKRKEADCMLQQCVEVFLRVCAAVGARFTRALS